ncbi:MAG: hypothetical protein LBU60_04775 [Clostridiales bacterium]|nr:hypothetical protein [Clostridiales bacterium]
MTNTMTMRKSNLVLPQSGCEVSRDEMQYVDGGGIYIDNNWVNGFFKMFSYSVTGYTIGELASAAAPLVSMALAWVNALPVLGQIVFCYIAANAFVVAVALVTAFVQNKGVDFGWSWFHVTYTVK